MTAEPQRPPVRWVATPPGAPRSRPVRRGPHRYTGPPAYAAPPRWGFPRVAWRRPRGVPADLRADAGARTAAITRPTALWLRCTAVVALLALGAELWRYGLLLMSRSGTLSAAVVAASDALVVLSETLLLVAAVISAGCALVWLVRARAAAARGAGVRNARSDWTVVLGTLVPGWNLIVPGAALAELEHTALIGTGDRSSSGRPVPSPLVRVWWACWSASLLLGWTGIAWGFRDGVQAEADGVLLHAWIAAVAAAVAVLSSRVVLHLRRLLAPLDPTELRRDRVVAVRGAELPPRRARPRASPR
ncbi:DUF4328 domain-containing protein [Salinifilum aidingensis]